MSPRARALVDAVGARGQEPGQGRLLIDPDFQFLAERQFAGAHQRQQLLADLQHQQHALAVGVGLRRRPRLRAQPLEVVGEVRRPGRALQRLERLGERQPQREAAAVLGGLGADAERSLDEHARA